MNQEPEYRAMLAVDIQGSGGRGNVPQLKIREILSSALADSFALSGIDLGACHRDDRGDGARVIVPRAVRKYRLIYPLMDELAAHLRAANELAGQKTRVRVRAALHAGDIYPDHEGGVAGIPLEVLARLLDAAPVRRALGEAPPAVPVAVIMSQHFYEETVPHGYPGIDAAAFRKVRIAEKEYAADAWLHLPGSPPPPGDPEPEAAPGETPSAPAADDRAAAGHSTMINKSSGHGVIYGSQGGPMYINHRAQS